MVVEQTQVTIKSDKVVSKFLDYMSTYSNATIFYSVSDIVLHIDSDASYLSLPHAFSRAAENYFLSNKFTNPVLSTANPPRPNGPIYILC